MFLKSSYRQNLKSQNRNYNWCKQNKGLSTSLIFTVSYKIKVDLHLKEHYVQ